LGLVRRGTSTAWFFVGAPPLRGNRTVWKRLEMRSVHVGDDLPSKPGWGQTKDPAARALYENSRKKIKSENRRPKKERRISEESSIP